LTKGGGGGKGSGKGMRRSGEESKGMDQSYVITDGVGIKSSSLEK